MSKIRKIIIHGKTHTEDERRRNSCNLATALKKEHRSKVVKLFYEAHLVDQPLEPQECAQFTFTPSPLEHSRLLDMAAALGLLQQLAGYPMFFDQREIRNRGEKESQILDILEANFDQETNRLAWVFSLRRFGRYSESEITDFNAQLKEGKYPSFVRPQMKRTIDKVVDIDLADLIAEIRTSFAKHALGFEPPILNVDWNPLLRELRYVEPKGSLNPTLLYALPLNLYIKLDYIREAFITKTILESDFDLGILNIGIAHVQRGRIIRWLNQTGIQVEKDPKTNALLREYEPLAQTNESEEKQIFGILDL